LEKNPAISYKFAEELGKGAYCKVFKAILRGGDEKEYAVRVAKIKNK
jgi:p21-activated kinase 2